MRKHASPPPACCLLTPAGCVPLPRADLTPRNMPRAAAAPPRAAAALLLMVAALTPVALGCSSFLVNCPDADGAVVTVRTLDFSSDLTAYTVSRATGSQPATGGHPAERPHRNRCGARRPFVPAIASRSCICQTYLIPRPALLSHHQLGRASVLCPRHAAQNITLFPKALEFEGLSIQEGQAPPKWQFNHTFVASTIGATLELDGPATP